MNVKNTPKNIITRRSFLKTAACLGLATAFAKKSIAQNLKPMSPPSPTSSSEGLTFNQSGYDIWIRFNNEIITAYRAHPSQKYPYMYPLAGPASGISLTTESALPWHHHRSVFFGCDRVNGDDYWSQELNKGRIISNTPKVINLTEKQITIFDECKWTSPENQVVMEDSRKITVAINSDKLYFIDWEIAWKAVVDVTIQKTNHSLFAIRAAPDITPSAGGNLINAEGDKGEKGTFGKKSEWCAFFGKRKKSEFIEGIALFDHPKNPWHICPWFTRDYGFMSPTTFNFIEKQMNFESGKSLMLKYRIVAFAGTPEEIKLANLWKSFSET
ncbi:MAG: PmoA family protein [Verrucomicrobiae bacterium]|nr:PmoA family protein [Verrucomicrobiae bacterium]